MAAYELAIAQCADYIEPDLVATKDGVLVARHENNITDTTDVAQHEEFADRRTTKHIDGGQVMGWFTEDFTLAELRTLRAIDRVAPGTSPDGTEAGGGGRHRVPTFDEVVELASRSRTCAGRPLGVYPETKRPTYFDSIGLSLEEEMLRVLERHGLGDEGAPVYIQSFETANLRELRQRTPLRLVQLIGCGGAPHDLVAGGDPRTYDDLTTADGLAEIARYADAIGVCKERLVHHDASGNPGGPTRLVRRAHGIGLEVHGWTFRSANESLPPQFRNGADPRAPGDVAGEIRAYLETGIDGFFTDNPDFGVEAVNAG